EVTSNTISGTVTSPSYDNRRNGVYVRFSDNTIIELVDDSPGTETNFTYTVPSLPNASITMAAYEGWVFGEARAVAYRSGVGSSEPVELTIPSPPVLNAPAQDSTLSDATVFSWSSDGSAFVWYII